MLEFIDEVQPFVDSIYSHMQSGAVQGFFLVNHTYNTIAHHLVFHAHSH